MNIKTRNRKILFILNKINISEQIYNNYIVDDGIYIPKNDKDLDINEENKLVIFDYKKVYSSDNSDYIYIHIHKFNRYITNNINKLCIKTINGRFGNKLIQYCNCIYFALKHNINIVEFNEPIDFMKERTIVLGDYKKRNTYTLSKYWVSWSDLYLNSNIKGYERDIEIYGNMYKYIMNKYIKSNLTLVSHANHISNHNYDSDHTIKYESNYTNINIDFSNKVLTIHIRGIDDIIYSIKNSYVIYMTKDNYLDNYLKLPVSYYIEIITKFKFKNIHIITEKLDLIILNELKDYCYNNNINIIIQSKSMKEDLETIINSDFLVLSKSSFCSMTIPFLNDNTVIFTPKVGDYIYCKNLLKSIKNVILVNV